MKVAIIYYSTYGHIVTMAEAVKAGIEKSGKASKVQIFQVPETLPKEVLGKMHAPAKARYPLVSQETLVEYDAFVFGYPTRFGNLPAQLSEFLGQTGGLWASGALSGKPVTFFTSVSSSAGGQEVTLRNFIPYAAHHGLVYIPLGYGAAFADLTNMDEPHGGSPYGAATFAGADGSRQPSALEKRIASTQGETFANSAIKFVFSKTAKPAEKPAQKAAAPVKKVQETASKVTEKPAQAARTTQSKMMAKHEEKSGCAKCVIM
ncbi:hypothetical protein JCM33374_g6114 [Metschnikowia sp. JCM 33374]|nr:hypothetical protein JCM33374_g6114 [Metschnikowia sp. JCM 33374]